MADKITPIKPDAIEVRPELDEANIAVFSKRIVDRALSPVQLLAHVTDFVWTAPEDKDVIALRTALDSRYPELIKRAEAGDDDAELALKQIEEEVLFFVGLEVGRRVKPD